MNVRLRLAKLETVSGAKNRYEHLTDAELDARIAVLTGGKPITEAMMVELIEACRDEH